MDEYISRSELQSEIAKGVGECRIRAFEPSVNCILQIIHRLPAADVQHVNQWISCKEQMPEDGISILICSERGTISKATYDSDVGYFYIADSELHYNQLDITHWQPLPQPPKDGDTNG